MNNQYSLFCEIVNSLTFKSIIWHNAKCQDVMKMKINTWFWNNIYILIHASIIFATVCPKNHVYSSCNLVVSYGQLITSFILILQNYFNCMITKVPGN